MLREIFLSKIKERHPCNFDKYDYTLLPDEFRNKNKIKILCKKHGEFEQRIDSHVFGKGCVKCHGDQIRIKRSSNIEEFISKANKIHNHKYSYDKVNYINSNTKVTIICSEHGEFNQVVRTHLSGKGCSKCGFLSTWCKTKSNTECFINNSKKIHGDRYNYSKVKYDNVSSKVIITCSSHGDFLQTPNSHLRGRGCPKCSESTGEKHIANILDKLNVQYIREYKLANYNYRYDFYLPEYNIYIEYHGEQHYRSVDYFGGEKAFIKLKRRDKAKIELIKRSTGLLIIINYAFDSLDKIKEEMLNTFNTIHPEFFNNREYIKEYIYKSRAYLIDNKIIYIRKIKCG